MKRRYVIGLTLGLVAAGVAVICAAQVLASGFLRSRTQGVSQADCRRTGTAHTVTVASGVVEPLHTKAKRCDTLTIVNRDEQVREMSFGVHDKHVPYDGVTQRSLATDQKLTVTLRHTGTFLFHDHYEEVVGGDFTVE